MIHILIVHGVQIQRLERSLSILLDQLFARTLDWINKYLHIPITLNATHCIALSNFLECFHLSFFNLKKYIYFWL